MPPSFSFRRFMGLKRLIVEDRRKKLEVEKGVAKMSTENMSKYEKRKLNFSRAKSLRAALNLVARPEFHHRMYQHYTTLENVLSKISKGEWWLSCCTSDRLNDQKEAVKYGSLKEARRHYQTCFCHGTGESVAMWGMYQCSKPCAVRISLTEASLRTWVKSLRANSGDGKAYDSVLFRDMVYLSVKDPDCPNDKYEVTRANVLRWEDASTNSIEDLQSEISEDWATGIVKDYEWRHERESRLLVKLSKSKGRGIKVAIPDDVLEDMRFTFSPWLSPNAVAKSEKLILDALVKRLKKTPQELNKSVKHRFRRSVLSGGLNIGDGRVPCVNCDTCIMFGRYECRY